MIVGINPCCCGPTPTPPVCCVLPPSYLDLTSYVWSGYDWQYEDAIYDYSGMFPIPNLADYILANPDSPYAVPCEESPFFFPTIGFDTYRYLTSTTIPIGAYAEQTQRIVLLINCDGNDFCVNGQWYYGPAQMFFADEDWNPVTHIDNVPKMETSGCVLLMSSDLGIYWEPPANADFLPSYWRSHCPSCTGNGRYLFTACDGTGGGDIIAEFPLSLGIELGSVYRLTLNSEFEGCYTATSDASAEVPVAAVTAASPREDCTDGDCAPVECEGPPYNYRVAYCIDPTTPVGYYPSADILAFGYVFREVSTEFPRYIVLDCEPYGELPIVFLPMGIEETACP